MRTTELADMYQLEETYWWFVGRRELVRQMVLRYAKGRQVKLLDAGCGTGGTLARVGDIVEAHGCDLSDYALGCCLQRGFRCLAAGDLMRLPYTAAAFDLVVSCDVLEHLPDDRVGLSEIMRILKPGGYLVMTVPAHQFLWSEHDEALSHLRRYSARQLRQLLQEAGADVVKLSPVVVVAFFPIMIFRLLQRLRPKKPEEPKTDLRVLPSPLNTLLISFLRLENWLLRYVNLPVGTSLVAVARKR